MSLHKIDHAIQGEFDIVLCVFFDFSHNPRIDVFNIHIKCSRGRGASLSKKHRPTIVFPDVFSELTGIPISIIKAYWVIYICLASRRLDIDPEKFEVYCDLLREEWDKEFPWYPWCVSMHHWQVHAPEIMRMLPPTVCVAMLNEVRLLTIQL